VDLYQWEFVVGNTKRLVTSTCEIGVIHYLCIQIRRMIRTNTTYRRYWLFILRRVRLSL
jgi:hypothetical protein